MLLAGMVVLADKRNWYRVICKYAKAPRCEHHLLSAHGTASEENAPKPRQCAPPLHLYPQHAGTCVRMLNSKTHEV